MPAYPIDSPKALAKRLRQLRHDRRELKATVVKPSRRLQVTHEERRAVLAKTAGRCHICGGSVSGFPWQADHVLPFAGGGAHAAENYLPAHALCNNYRWDYLAEEFQWILKIGVWARLHIEKETPLGLELATRFAAYEKARQRRRQAGGKMA